MPKKNMVEETCGSKFQLGSIVSIDGTWKVIGIRNQGGGFMYEIEHANQPATSLWIWEHRLKRGSK